MITDAQKGQLLQILQSPQWNAVEQIANSLCDKISYESTLRDTEWETLKETVLNEGQIRGIKRLLNELYSHAHD